MGKARDKAAFEAMLVIVAVFLLAPIWWPIDKIRDGIRWMRDRRLAKCPAQ